MEKNSKYKIWFQQIRGPFLILSVALVAIGAGAAYQQGTTRWDLTLLVLLGVILSHISVNLFNEYSDYQTGIDSHTKRTPFSGGSGLLQSGTTTPQAVRAAAYISLVLTALIGIYFCLFRDWRIFIFMIIGGLAIRFYTSHLAKWLLGEIIAGLTLGTFVVIGTFIVICRTFPAWIFLLAVPPGLLTALLLFLNEFPDVEADKIGGRYHLVIHFGRAVSSKIYALILWLTYLVIAVGPFISAVPITTLIAFLTLPVACAASIKVLRYHSHPEKLLPALGMNVLIIIGTDFLLAVGCFVGRF